MTERRGCVMESDNVSRHTACCDYRCYPEEALGLPYYHPTVATMREVRDLFLKYLETNGFYLLRKSFTKSSTLTVSVVFNGALKHFTISRKETGAYFLQGKLFASIHDLVYYYGKQEVPNKEEISGIYLKHPVLDSNRHNFFANTSRRLEASGVKTQPEVWTRSSRREKNEDRQTDRMKNCKMTSQSFTVKVPTHTPEYLDARNGNAHNRSLSQGSCHQVRPLSGYLQLDLRSAEATFCSASSGPMSLGVGADVGRRRQSPELDPVFPDDRTWFNQQPTTPRLQSRHLQQEENDQRTVTQSPISPPTAKAPQLQYSYARSPYEQLAPSLVERLREIEGDNAIKCECGVYHDDAELPRGWSFHKSTEPDTYGRVLFTGPEGQLDWNLPLEVSLELSADQQDKIRDLICRPSLRPCSHLLDARRNGPRSTTSLAIDSGYEALGKQDT